MSRVKMPSILRKGGASDGGKAKCRVIGYGQSWAVERYV